MDLAQEAPFLRAPTPPAPSAAGGFESAQGATNDQKTRAADLFLRGALTPEDYARARASGSGFEAIVGRPNFLPAAFLETGAAVSRCVCLVRTSGIDYLGRTGAWADRKSTRLNSSH